MKQSEKFINLRCVRQSPGNDTFVISIRAETIMDVSDASPEYAKVGGASSVSSNLGMLVCTHSREEVMELLSKVECYDS